MSRSIDWMACIIIVRSTGVEWLDMSVVGGSHLKDVGRGRGWVKGLLITIRRIWCSTEVCLVSRASGVGVRGEGMLCGSRGDEAI